MEELFGSQHKNKNMQMRHTRNVKITSHCCNDHHIKRGNSYFNMKYTSYVVFYSLHGGLRKMTLFGLFPHAGLFNFSEFSSSTLYKPPPTLQYI